MDTECIILSIGVYQNNNIRMDLFCDLFRVCGSTNVNIIVTHLVAIGASQFRIPEYLVTYCYFSYLFFQLLFSMRVGIEIRSTKIKFFLLVFLSECVQVKYETHFFRILPLARQLVRKMYVNK